MALFGSSKKKTTTIKKVRPTVVRTQNVAKELFKLANSYDIKPELLDFTILGVQSYTRMNSKEKEGEWEEIENEALHTVDESQLLTPEFEIKQTYEIEIFSKDQYQNEACMNFTTAVGANATKCKVYLSINSGASVEYFPRFEIEFDEMIKKRKVRAGILIHIFDEMMPEVISKISARLKVEGHLEFSKSETFLIAQGYEPTATTHDALILHYEKKEQLDEQTKVDYASRGFIQSVKEGELLIEYIKPKEGKPGRNCRGEFLQPEEPKVSHEPTFNVSDNIKVVDTPDAIQYIAKENGYIAFEDNTYVIKKEVDVSEVSFKTTGSIKTGLDSDVNMSVKESNAVKDAVGTGMVVEVSTIEVDGNVGSNAKVIANKAHIGGQTHKTAYVEADELNINVHKGRAKGKNVHITRLEHGEVYADVVAIQQAIGGDIKAQEIMLEICASHVKATASRLIEIKKMQGSENIFTIDPLLQEENSETLKKNEEKIKDIEKQLRELKKEIQHYTAMIKDGTQSFLEIKKRLIHYKKNGVKLPASFVKKYKQFQEMQEHLKSLQKDYEMKNDELNLLSTQKGSLQEDIFDARIINRDRWIGYNEIKFRLVDPPMELVYKPAEGSQDKIFAVVEVDEDEYAIRPVRE